MTLSIGLAAFQETDAAIDDVLSRADAACYQAKAKGRNAVMVSESLDGVCRSDEIDELF